MSSKKDVLQRFSLGLSLMFGLYWLFALWIAPRLSLSSFMRTILGYGLLYGLGSLIVYRLLVDQPSSTKPAIRLSAKTYGLLFLLVCFAITLLFVLVNVEIHLFRIEPINQDVRFESVFDYIVLLGLAPFFEELVLRKFLGDKLLIHGEALYLSASAFFFGLIHAPVTNWKVVLCTFYLGFLLAWIYAKTKSLATVYVYHALYNVIGGLLLTWIGRFVSPEAMGLYSLMIIALGLFGLILLIIKRRSIDIDGRPTLFWPRAWRAILRTPGTYIFLLTGLIALIGFVSPFKS